jgi:hypothetical protein
MASQNFIGIGSRFPQFLRDSAPSLSLESFSLELAVLQWHRPSGHIQIVALIEAVLDWFKACVAKHATLGLTYRIYGRDRRAENPIKYLIGLGFEAPRPYYASHMQFP